MYFSEGTIASKYTKSECDKIKQFNKNFKYDLDERKLKRQESKNIKKRCEYLDYYLSLNSSNSVTLSDYYTHVTKLVTPNLKNFARCMKIRNKNICNLANAIMHVIPEVKCLNIYALCIGNFSEHFVSLFQFIFFLEMVNKLKKKYKVNITFYDPVTTQLEMDYIDLFGWKYSKNIEKSKKDDLNIYYTPSCDNDVTENIFKKNISNLKRLIIITNYTKDYPYYPELTKQCFKKANKHFIVGDHYWEDYDFTQKDENGRIKRDDDLIPIEDNYVIYTFE
jgi:hypothetical protein